MCAIQVLNRLPVKRGEPFLIGPIKDRIDDCCPASRHLPRPLARSTPSSTIMRLPLLLAANTAFVLTSFACSSASAHPGAAIFQEKCASCHGADGQGDPDGYDEPLYGDHSAAVLARQIERTMPEEEPESCVGDEARAVAEYMYHEFYSFGARQKKGLVSAPRIELTRLTVPQYRNAIADLVGHFTPRPQQDDASTEPGFSAEYFQSKGMSKADQLKQQRVDWRIDFDFGEGSPAEDITADQFTIIWQGALVAAETGHYEFRVRTQNGARLYLNNDSPEQRRRLRDDSSVAGQAAFIDAWVSSGQMREHTARAFLLGGRQYPLRLEFFKYKEETASIQLEWKPPQGVWQVLDGDHLVATAAPRTFIVDTPFPADDRSLGYERGSSISPQWQTATSDAAIATATEVVNRLPLLAGLKGDASSRGEQVTEFVTRFARVAFRRWLTNDEDQLLRELVLADTANPEVAVRRAVLLVLSSPHFLYTDPTSAQQPPSQHAIATRLSLALWDSIPDRLLLEAADAGELATEQQIEAQVWRMLGDSRARAKLQDFFRHWLELEERDLAKDKEMFPDFDQAVIADLRYSLQQFVDQVVWSEQSDYRELLLADYLLLNDRLRAFYQSKPADDTAVGDKDDESQRGFQRVPFAPGQRAGVLTHPYLLSALAYHNDTSPIHRGVFLTRNVVGRALKPPPVAVAFKADEFSPDLTMREKITQLTRDSACMACHSVINPLGFALENYDAVGRWRTSANEKPLDTKSRYVTVTGDVLEVQNALDIAKYAVTHEAAHRSFVVQMFQHVAKQTPLAYGPDTMEQLRLMFVSSDFNIQKLVAKIALVTATQGRFQASPSDPAP